MIRHACALVISGILLAGCHHDTAPASKWAIAIHGGAGCYSPDWTPEQYQAHMDGLTRALEAGRDRLAKGGSALDTVEAVVRILEDDPNFNAGKGAVMTERGEHELDAAIMDGSTLKCGAVASLKTVKNPVSFARQVMERTRHVMFVGPEADALAASWNLEIVSNASFNTPAARQELDQELQRRRTQSTSVTDADLTPDCLTMGTVGCVALDSHGHLAAATSTGGLTGKMPGRVGDVPIIGAGTFADADVAISCTGIGEQFIRNSVARQVASLVELDGMSLDAACHRLIFRVLRPQDGGLIAVSRTGEIVLMFSTDSMCRAAADGTGRFEVSIEGE